jgi:hypothetical protein
MMLIVNLGMIVEVSAAHCERSQGRWVLCMSAPACGMACFVLGPVFSR